MILKKLKTLYSVSANARMSSRELAALRDSRLRQMVRHAYETTRFYRRSMDGAGIKPEDIRSAADLVHLPTVSKVEMQARYEEVISRRFSEADCLVRTTSGSSGKMLRVLWETDSFWNRLCMYYRCLAMIGYTPFKKLLYFLPTPEKTGFTFGLFRQLGLEPGLPLATIKKHLLEFRPHVLAVYPSYAVDLGNYLSAQEITAIGIEAISLNSEVVLPHDRAEIERRFRCPTFDEYSSVEMGFIASMCRHKRMHVFTDNVAIEILDDQGRPAGPGERGEIVLTSLTNFAMPFIRYRIGDFSCFAHEKKCACGLPFPIIGPIEGRKDDSFWLEGGERVPAWRIYEAVERPLEEFGMDKMVLADFYLVQKGVDTAQFFYVKGPDFEEEYLKKLRTATESLFGAALNVEIREVDDIDRVKAVKRKYIHCELQAAAAATGDPHAQN